MEKKKLEIRKKISSLFEMPKEIVLDLPLVSIIGKEEVNIENYKGVIEYTDDRIRINTSCGVLKIAGKKLTLKQITNENIMVTGVITAMEYLM